MFCANCGSQVDDKAKFCTNCGAPLAAAEQPAAVKEETPAAPEPEVKEVPQDGAPSTTQETPVVEDAAPEPETVDVQAEAAPEESFTEKVKKGVDETVESAKSMGEGIAASATVQDAKKELHDMFDEAKTASRQQAGQAVEDENAAQPRESVSFFVKWFYWSGRRGRKDYLVVCLICKLIAIVFGATMLVPALLCYMGAVNTAKRLHDIGKSGWLALLLMLIEYASVTIGWFMGLLGLAFAAGGYLSGLILGAIPMLIVLAINIWLFLKPGTPGSNEYGPEPR